MGAGCRGLRLRESAVGVYQVIAMQRGTGSCTLLELCAVIWRVFLLSAWLLVSL